MNSFSFTSLMVLSSLMRQMKVFLFQVVRSIFLLSNNHLSFSCQQLPFFSVATLFYYLSLNYILICVLYFADVPEGSFIVRAHSPMSNLFSCLWFNEVDRFTSRDQLSFAHTFLKLRRMNPEKPFSLNMFKVTRVQVDTSRSLLKAIIIIIFDNTMTLIVDNFAIKKWLTINGRRSNTLRKLWKISWLRWVTFKSMSVEFAICYFFLLLCLWIIWLEILLGSL